MLSRCFSNADGMLEKNSPMRCLSLSSTFVIRSKQAALMLQVLLSCASLGGGFTPGPSSKIDRPL